MEEWGNARANAYYEANVPDNVYRPKEGDQVKVVEKYIRDKYEYKKYIAKNLPPKEEDITSNNITSTNTPATTDNNNKRTSQNNNQLNIKIGSAPSSTNTRPLKIPQPPVPAVPVAEVSLIDFLDDPVQQASPIVTPATSASPGVSLSLQQPTQPPQQQQQFTNFMDGYGNQSSSAASPTTTTTTTTTTAVGIISSTTTTTNGRGYDFPGAAQAQVVSPQPPASHITPTVSDRILLLS